MVHIVVLVKQVPDPGSERALNPGDHTVLRDVPHNVVSSLDEYAIAEALRAKATVGGEVTVLTIGPESASEVVRVTLAMGADRGIHVVDPAIHGSCAVQTSSVLAAALRQIDFDLVLCGAESADAHMSVMSALLSERLGIAQLSGATTLTLDGDQITVERQSDGSLWVLQAQLPAIVSCRETMNEPRAPSLKDVMAARNKAVEKKTLADLDIDPDAVGLTSATTAVLDVCARPPKEGRMKVVDEGDGAARLVDFLANRQLI